MVRYTKGDNYMYLQELNGILPAQKIKIKYDCDGGFERCGKEWELKLKDAQKNFGKNNGKHMCRKCTLRHKNPMYDKKNVEKVKKTNLEKYGIELPLNSKKHIEARKEQFKDPEFKEKWLEKHRQTSLEKYGVEHHMKSDVSKKNQKKSMREKYGVDHPYQSTEIMAKMRAKNKEKYGVENVASLPEVQIKMAQTRLEKYGVEHYNQLPEMREYLRENCTEWLAESYKNPWAKGITRPEEWNQKQRETVAKRIVEGKWPGGFISNCRGRYKAIKCRKKNPRFLSSLELQMHFFLDNHPDVIWYDYECLVIPYLDKEGKKHLYFPDFVVKYKKDPIEHIIETKTWKDKDSITVQLKHDAAIDYATERNMTYTILFDEDIQELGLNLEVIKQLAVVELY